MLRGLRKHLKRWLKRRRSYREPRAYWERRGQVYRGQEEALDGEDAVFGLQARFIAEQVYRLEPHSILEVGCGYGRLLRRLQERCRFPVLGIDFSSTQLHEAQRYLSGLPVRLALADAAHLPFSSGAFDVVLTSGVLMHVYPARLRDVIRELSRVSRRWLVHNEDLVPSAHAFGHDLRRAYSAREFRISECILNPHALSKQKLQFLIVEMTPER